MATPPVREHYNILSIAGGNDSFALFQPRVIGRLENTRPDFLKNTQVFAGTSAGALTALALASEKNDPDAAIKKATRLINHFARLQPNLIIQMGRILSKFAWDPLQLIPQTAMWLQVLCSPLYGFRELTKVLEDEFGNMTLGDLHENEQYVVIPSFRLDSANRSLQTPTWKPRIFQNLEEKSHTKNFDFRLVDIALAAIPDPLTFPVYLGSEDKRIQGNYIDGFVYAVNPSLTAITYTLRSIALLDPTKVLKPIQDHFAVLSVGSCWPPNRYLNVNDKGNWGMMQWMVTHPGALLQVVQSAGYVSTMVQAQTLLSNRFYYHLDNVITRIPPTVYELDSSLTEAVQLADSVNLLSARNFVRPEGPWGFEGGE